MTLRTPNKTNPKDTNLCATLPVVLIEGIHQDSVVLGKKKNVRSKAQMPDVRNCMYPYEKLAQLCFFLLSSFDYTFIIVRAFFFFWSVDYCEVYCLNRKKEKRDRILGLSFLSSDVDWSFVCFLFACTQERTTTW